MRDATKIGVGVLAVVSSLTATSAFSQSLIGRDSVAGDLNEDLAEAIEEDAERDLDRFGNEGRVQGFSGNFALRGTAQTGNSESQDLGIGADLNYVWGPNGVQLQLNYAFSDDDASASEESLFYSLEYTRDLNTRTYGFAKVQGSVDSATDAAYESDTFISFGAGYRVLNEADTQWSVQAGPGYRVANLNDIASADVDEAAFGVSSNYAKRLTETVFVTNDTDVIWSDSDTAVFNDLALSVAMTNTLSLRTSVLTEYHSEVTAPSKHTDNTFGVSLVYSF